MGDKRVFQDATRTVELHHIKGLPHADGMLIAYLPKERIIAYGDMFNLPAPNAPPPTEANVAHVVMVDNLERLKPRLRHGDLGARAEPGSADSARRTSTRRFPDGS